MLFEIDTTGRLARIYPRMTQYTAKIKTTFLVLFAGAALAGSVVGPGTLIRGVEAQRSGSAIYAQNCARCHGTDGRAQTRKGREVDATDLTSDDWFPDAGRDTRIVTRGKGSMPAFGRRLTSAQIGSVVQYIRRFKR